MEMGEKEIIQLEKECRETARAMTREKYALYDAIWTDRIRIDSAITDHGMETVKELLVKMPNLLVYHQHVSSADEVAERYGFESTSALVEYLLAYTPRGPVEEELFQQMFDASLREMASGDEYAADIPF